MQTPRVSSSILCWGLALMLALTVAPFLKAQQQRSIVGDWEGTLDPGAKPKQRIVIHITAAQDGTLSGTIDYPDQDTSGIQMTAITYKQHVLHFECTSNLSVYDGTMSDDKSVLNGTLKQGGGNLSLVLKRTP
jgi:hypothetical protein